MPRTDVANQAIRDLRRNKIIETAASVFARKGLAGTKISDLAAAAEMSQGLLYRYFTSKEAVFDAVIETVAEASVQLRDMVHTLPGTATEKLRWLTEQLLFLQGASPAYALVVAHALTNETVTQGTQGRAVAETATLWLALCDIIAAGQVVGEMIAGDADQLAMLYLAALHGLAAGAPVYAALKLPYPAAETLMAFVCHPSAPRPEGK